MDPLLFSEAELAQIVQEGAHVAAEEVADAETMGENIEIHSSEEENVDMEDIVFDIAEEDEDESEMDPRLYQNPAFHEKDPLASPVRPRIIEVKNFVEMIPEVLGIGPPRAIPTKVIQGASELKQLADIMKSRKQFSALSAAEKRKVQSIVTAWQKNEPQASEKLFKQLHTEILAYIFGKQFLKKKSTSHQEGDADNNSEEDMDENEKVQIGDKKIDKFVTELFSLNNESENDIMAFVLKLKDHKAFRRYKNEMDSMSDSELSALVWRVSVQAQRMLIRLSKWHENLVDGIHKMSRLNGETAEKVTFECDNLSAAVTREAAAWSENVTKSDSTFPGRKHICRSLCSPYFKATNGLAMPKETFEFLPYRYQDLREELLSESEQQMLQNCVLTAVILKKTERLNDRCVQLLTKCKENEMTDVSSTLYTSPESGLRIEMKFSIRQLLVWKEKSIKIIEATTVTDIAQNPHENIDWYLTAAKMRRLVGRPFTPERCQKAWTRMMAPRLSGQTITSINDIQRLMSTVSRIGTADWDIIASMMGNGVTTFDCFQAYKKFVPGEMSAEQRQEMAKDNLNVATKKFVNLVKMGADFTPHLKKTEFVDLACKATKIINTLPNISYRTVATTYNRFYNPSLKKGKFEVMEDILLLVVMVKLRKHIMAAENLSLIQYYLPWRHLSSWSGRADILFTRRSSTWTRDEDLTLLEFAQAGEKFDFKRFSPFLAADKQRKNARWRYLQIQNQLETSSFNSLTEYYHSKPRSQFVNYEKYLPSLRFALTSPMAAVPAFDELKDHPSQALLWIYLRSFEKEVIMETLNDIETLVDLAKQTTTENTESPYDLPLPRLDRRRFTRGDPASTASTLVMRKVSLIQPPPACLNEFETIVYQYYRVYGSRSVKTTTTQAKYLPKPKELVKLSELRNIIMDPDSQEKLADDFESDGIPLDEKGFPILDNHQPAKAKTGRKKKRPVPKNIGRPKKIRVETVTTDEAASAAPDPLSCLEVSMETEPQES